MQFSSEHHTGSDARFAGRTIIVTGAGAGIGRATVLALIANGATVIAADLSTDRLQSLSEEAGTDRLHAVAGDLTDDGAVDRVVASAGDRIDGVASVAGIFDGWLPPGEVDDKTWDNVMELNVTVPMRLTRAVLPTMIRAGKGALVFTSSEAGLRSSVSGAAYTTSKHALHGFVKSVAYYYGPTGVRSNAVAPGAVQTAMDIEFRSKFAKERAATAIATATQVVEPEVVTRAMLWLLSDDSDNVNGVIMPTDNGWSTF
ncbi:SDR family NAD(P)-dependent oxidoreductase [Mycobacterium sp. AZCC_0083]|uniref:SDR family NAD(P)-dependent oxidoreductase n=1 Tax=Mycobacterium sp. AZCC_0083 TaxID=2735882 RepID=UPI001618C1FD|nr:SDR family oxidoreductase [Mycobacterium sp. AZCC_0083]MBB5167851.1 NAD(P)-dependent dehydrogenase (short-subunit alcohol dehydrogenase family) [Mycobacterium sp. AZCC_0083]